MRRDWITFTGVSLACVVTWSLLFIVFFRAGDEGIDSSIAMNEETEFNDVMTQEKEKEGNRDSINFAPIEKNGETESSILEVEEEMNNDTDHDGVSSIGSVIEDGDTDKLSLDNIHDRGIQVGDFDHIAPEGIISIDDILREIMEEEG